MKKKFAEPENDPFAPAGETEDTGSAPTPDAQGDGEIGLRIVRGAPLLPRTRQAGQSKYAVADFAIGDMYVSPEASVIRNVIVAARAYSKRQEALGKPVPKFVSRKTPQGEYALQRVA